MVKDEADWFDKVNVDNLSADDRLVSAVVLTGKLPNSLKDGSKVEAALLIKGRDDNTIRPREILSNERLVFYSAMDAVKLNVSGEIKEISTETLFLPVGTLRTRG